MGVPGFYNWLIKRYPLCLQPKEFNQGPNIDCLYIDMNSIIYKIISEGSQLFSQHLIPKDKDEIILQLFNYINLVINLIQPQQLIFLCFDGPAPISKQNHSKVRRYKQSLQEKLLMNNIKNIGLDLKIQNVQQIQITTGTYFMAELNQQIEYMIQRKIYEDDRWKKLKIIFSGSDVPGEGEHKILSYMRQFSNEVNYVTTTSHCIYSPDADLIMLALATRIQYICILREEQVHSGFGQQTISKATNRLRENLKFNLLYINIVREYFDLEFQSIKSKMNSIQYNINNIIDDFILICFFIGNDFLPRCYCFDINAGNFEQLIVKYQEYLQNATEYLNQRGNINWKSFEKLMKFWSEYEQNFIKDRISEINKTQKEQNLQEETKEDIQNSIQEDNNNKVEEQKQSEQKEKKQVENHKHIIKKQNNDSNIENIRNMDQQFIKQFNQLLIQDQYKARQFYYKEKINIDSQNDEKFNQNVNDMVDQYIQGLQFVLFYYYQGLPSWNWFYPFHYSPLASDIYNRLIVRNNNEQQFNIQFDKGQPSNQIEQLIATINPYFSWLLPKCYQDLLMNKTSPLRSPIDYYPDNVKIDSYGAYWDNQFIMEVPFINLKLIQQVCSNIEQNQKEEFDKKQNTLGSTYLYQYDDKNQQILCKSTLPLYFDDFQISMSKLEWNIDDKFKEWNYEIINQSDTIRFPSLYLRKISSSYLKSVGQNKKQKMIINLNENENKFNFEKVINQQQIFAYYNYPNCRYCEVIGWINKENLVILPQFQNNVQILTKQNYKDKQDHQKIWDYIINIIQKDLQENGIEIENISKQTICFIRIYHYIQKSFQGIVSINKDINYGELFLPSILLQQECKIQQNIDNLLFDSKANEFIINDKVIIFGEQLIDGSLGYIQQINQNQKIQIRQLTKPILFKQERIQYFESSETVYYSLKYIAEKLGTKTQVLLSILDQLYIEVDYNLPSHAFLDDKIDIGLNLIQKKNNIIVNDLIKINFEQQQKELNGQNIKLQNIKIDYQQLLISNEAVVLLQQYCEKMKNLLILLSQLIEQYPKKPFYQIRSTQIFNQPLDANIELLKFYGWIMQAPSSKYQLNSVRSNCMDLKKIKILQSLINNQQIKNEQIDQLEIDPNYVYKQNFDRFIPISFLQQPPFPRLGMRIMNINPLTQNSIPFGLQGTVIGITEYYIEVYFDKPFIGQSTLGGKCMQGRAANIKFGDIYVLDYWNKYLYPRSFQQQINQWTGFINVNISNSKIPNVVDSDEKNVENTKKYNLKSLW